MSEDVKVDGRAKLARIEELLAQVERFRDAGERRVAREAVQAVMDFHGAAVERLLELLAAREDGLAAIDAVAGDDLVSSLLLLYGLHPMSLEERVEAALAELRGPDFALELVGVSGGVARVRARGTFDRQLVEQAIVERAPEVTSVEVAEEVEGGGVRVGLPILS